jgi:hypothetical protein
MNLINLIEFNKENTIYYNIEQVLLFKTFQKKEE